jgi:hypothetical protein
VATLDDYLSLITAEHNQRDRFMRTVALSVQPYVDGINVANSLIGLFDLDTAVGQALDFLGQWVGVTRNVSIALDIYFAFDEARVGFDQGLWIQPYETANQNVALDDDHYRLLLRGRIASNFWDGTIPGAYNAWNTLFAGTGYQILIQDGLARAEAQFSFDRQGWGFDQSIWYVAEPLANVYFSFDSPDLLLGFDEGSWYGPPGTALTQPYAVTNGNMHIIMALLGPPLDPITQALFTGGYLTLISAGVAVHYMMQNQGAGPGMPDGVSGIGLPLFGFDAGPIPSTSEWMSFDIPPGLDAQPLYLPGAAPGDAAYYWMSLDVPPGLDKTTLFYPGAHPIDPKFEPTYLTFDGNDPSGGLDAGWWTPAVRPNYLVFDSAAAVNGLDSASWYTSGASWWDGTPYPPPYDPDEALPPTGVTWPPVALAGFDLGAFGEILTPGV